MPYYSFLEEKESNRLLEQNIYSINISLMGKNYWAINKSYVEGGNNGLRKQEKLETQD